MSIRAAADNEVQRNGQFAERNRGGTSMRAVDGIEEPWG